MPDTRDILYGDDWTRADLEKLSASWTVASVTETDDETEVVFEHEHSDATCTVTADHNRVDLPHSMRLDPPVGDAVTDEADWGGDIVSSADIAMQAFDEGTKTR